jgi:hypothetical protein
MGVAIFCNKMEKSRKTRLDGFYDNGKYTEAKAEIEIGYQNIGGTRNAMEKYKAV